MTLSIKAAAPFHFFGVDYDAGDPIDVTGLTGRALAQLLKHQPVYVSDSYPERTYTTFGHVVDNPTDVPLVGTALTTAAAAVEWAVVHGNPTAVSARLFFDEGAAPVVGDVAYWISGSARWQFFDADGNELGSTGVGYVGGILPYRLTDDTWLPAIPIPAPDGAPINPDPSDWKNASRDGWGFEAGYYGTIGGKLYFGGGDSNLYDDGSGVADSYGYKPWDASHGRQFMSYDPTTGDFATLPVKPHGIDFAAYGVADGKLYVAQTFPANSHLDVFDPQAMAWMSYDIEAARIATVFLLEDWAQGVQVGRFLFWLDQGVKLDLDADPTSAGAWHKFAVPGGPDSDGAVALDQSGFVHYFSNHNPAYVEAFWHYTLDPNTDLFTLVNSDDGQAIHRRLYFSAVPTPSGGWRFIGGETTVEGTVHSIDPVVTEHDQLKVVTTRVAALETTELGDAARLPATSSGDAAKVLTVKGDGTGYELDTPSTGFTPENQQFAATTTSVPTGGGFGLVWGSPSGAALLDLTDPTAPTVVASGLYQVQISFRADPVAAKSYQFALGLDPGGADLNVRSSGSLDATAAGPGGDQASSSMTWTGPVPAGGGLSALFAHDAGVDHDVILRASVTRLA